MWNWVSKESKRQKRKVTKLDYFEAMGIDKEDIPILDCYCCEFLRQQNLSVPDERNCCLCPIDWRSDLVESIITPNCMNLTSRFDKDDGYFEQWLHAKDYKIAAKMAKVIANLPEKGDNK